METETKRKNMDYSASAVNLVNPSTVDLQLVVLEKYEFEKKALEDKIQKCIPPELTAEMLKISDCISVITNQIKEQIEKEGSYQDLVNGRYAIKQRKVSKSYNANAFEHNYPQFAPAVIIKAVDVAKLTGLIKGGLLDEDNLKNPDVGIITEKESFAYIIKV